MSSIAATMSSMGFNHADHFRHLSELHFFFPFFYELDRVAKKSSIVSWVSPAIGITVGTAQLIVAMGTVFEAGIKGITNLAVGLTTFNTSLLGKGCQFFVFVPVFGVCSIPASIFNALITTTRMVVNPQEASKKELEACRISLARFSMNHGIM